MKTTSRFNVTLASLIPVSCAIGAFVQLVSMLAIRWSSSAWRTALPSAPI
jgi:hypothetical protein